MPELGEFPGPERKTTFVPKNYKAVKADKGVKVFFTLPRGSYATVLIDWLLSPP
jgi:tRNA(Glu) U13 pseudouridine synthase TruD